MQNSNGEDLKLMLRVQKTETTQQPVSDVRSSELPILSQTRGIQGDRSELFWAFVILQPDQHCQESLLLPIHLSVDTSHSYRSDQELAKKIMHSGISTILQPTRTTGKNLQWTRFIFHQYSKDLRGKQLHNYRDTEIRRVKKDCMEIYSARSTTFWWVMGRPHLDEQTTLLQYRRIKETPGRQFHLTYLPSRSST